MMPQKAAEASGRASFRDSIFEDKKLDDLKGQSVRGGVAVVSVQGMKLVLQTVSVMTLARLLSPADFGLMAMVTVVTGILGLFRDAGLSVATVQRDVITHEQTSTLFWINVAVGFILAGTAAALAPVLVIFYREPVLLWLTVISSAAFIFNGFAAQHQALLVRKLKFAQMALIDLLSLASGIAVAITMAYLGFRYWSLAAMAVGGPAIAAVALWLMVPWVPGLPRRNCGIRSMLNLGGVATCENVVMYLGYNTEKFLLGRFWGASVLGVYGKTYQLINLPLQYLSSSVFNVVFSALSRLQSDKERACRFFLKGYSLLLSICVPITISSALFAGDIIPIILGPKWNQAVPILVFLAPTVVAFALINPFGWFLLATGRALRSLYIAFMITPSVVLGILAGIHYGPIGVACGYSTAMILLTVPVIAWAKKDYPMTFKDVWNAVKGPVLSGLAAVLAGAAFRLVWDEVFSRYLHLFFGLLWVLGVYFAVLMFGLGRWPFYSDLIKHIIRNRSSQGENIKA